MICGIIHAVQKLIICSLFFLQKHTLLIPDVMPVAAFPEHAGNPFWYPEKPGKEKRGTASVCCLQLFLC